MLTSEEIVKEGWSSALKYIMSGELRDPSNGMEQRSILHRVRTVRE